MKHRWLPLAVILLLAGLLTLLTQNSMQTSIVTPLLYLLWVGRLIFDSIPQIAIWVLFLFIALIIAANSLLSKRHPAPRVLVPETRRAERIKSWAALIRRAGQDDYYQWQLAQHLYKVAAATLAHDERLTSRQIRQRLENELLDVPPEIQTYLQVGTTSFSHFLEAKPRFSFRLRKKTSLPQLNPAQLIQFLEDKLDHYPN